MVPAACHRSRPAIASLMRCADVRYDGEYVDAHVAGLDEAALAREEALLKRFLPEAATARRTLADIIMSRIAEKEAAADGADEEDEEGDDAGGGAGAGGVIGAPRLDPKIVEVYSEVGKYLSHYKSGKLPKVFKLIPGLANWEEIVFLTNPETWTPHATYAATRIFASAFNPAKAQRYYNLVLLPKCRDDIYFTKRLNFHLFLALKKATYKPAAFYKGEGEQGGDGGHTPPSNRRCTIPIAGILLPLVSAPDCTLREAIIIGSVIAKASIPQLHSAAALMKVAVMRYSGAVSVALRVLLNKKYALPHVALDEVAAHFERFLAVEGPLPVVWHTSLLTLAQRYKADLTAEQKETLRRLSFKHAHPTISHEVRRELASAGNRGDPVSALVSADGSGGAAAAAAGAGRAAVRPAARARGGAAMDIEY